MLADGVCRTQDGPASLRTVKGRCDGATMSSMQKICREDMQYGDMVIGTEPVAYLQIQPYRNINERGGQEIDKWDWARERTRHRYWKKKNVGVSR